MNGHDRECGARTALTPELARAAEEIPGKTWQGLAPFPSCVLEEHHAAQDHYGCVPMLADKASSVWTRWAEGREPTTVFVLPECDTGSRPCCSFGGHPGVCTWAQESEEDDGADLL